MMNHDGSQQYTFGYGLATTPQLQQLQQQQQQQIQLQQHHFQRQSTQTHPQILQQHHGNSTASIPAQNMFQLQVGGSPAAAAILQQNETAAAASPTIVQHTGLISQPVIHGSISVSLENTINKPLQVAGLNNTMEAAMVYPQPQHQGNGLKIITNSGSFMQQQQQPEIHFQNLTTADNLGHSGAGTGIFEGVPGAGGVVAATQSNIGTAFGKQPFSGWVRDVASGGNQQPQYSVGQNASLPSFGHLWSQFQQQKTQVSIIQQQQQQQQPMQVHQFQSPHSHITQQAQQQFTVSGMQGVNNIQMIKVQQTPNALQDQTVLQPAATPTAPLFQHNMLLTAQHTSNSSPLPQINCLSSSLASISQSSAATVVSTDPTSNSKDAGITVGQISSVMSGVLGKTDSNLALPIKKSNKNVQKKTKSTSQDTHSSMSSLPPSTVQGISSSADTAVRIRPSNRKALSESGPPKVTVTLDSLPSTPNNLSQFPEKPDPIHQVVKGTTTEKGVAKFSPRNQLEKNQPTLGWQHQSHTNGSPEKKKLMTPNHLISSTGSSLDRPSSEDSNFSSPPYSFTPPSSIDSVFSPPPVKDTTHQVALNPADIFIQTLPLSSSLKSTSTSSPPPIATNSSLSSDVIYHSNDNHRANSLVNDTSDGCQSALENDDSFSVSSTHSSSSHTSVFTNSIMSASCCSIAITTTSVTSSSPRTYKGDIAIAASVHSLSPLTSPGVSFKSKKGHHSLAGSQNVRNVEQQAQQKQVRVPYSWQRNLDDGAIVYLSPSGAVLTSLDEIRDYLLSHDTCKCGLECPFQLEDVFIFDPAIGSLPWSQMVGSNGTDTNPMGNLCNHRREILAMAAFHQSQTHARQVLSDADNIKGRKREGRKSYSSGDDFIISPLKKLRTSITNAVNRHALLHNNSSGSPASSTSNLTSPMSEFKNSWQKDDSVFFPISNSLNNNNSKDKIDSSHNGDELFACSITTDLSSNKSLEEERQKFLNNSENLVYSNHHPSQRLGSKGHYAHQHGHGQQNIPPIPHGRRNSPSSSLSPHNVTDPFLYHHQKSIGSFMHINNNNNCDLFDKEREALSIAESPNLLCYDDDSNSGMFSSHQEIAQITSSGTIKGGLPCPDENTIGYHHSGDENKSGLHSVPLTPSSAVSFFENPAVFVAQQTAMINNSISSCNINSPSPGFLDDSVTLLEPKIKNDKVDRSKSMFLVSEEEEVGEENNLDTSREEDEEHKANTDLESNKSFSDTTENNDSAYLSQTGSDQEKSDTVDGLDCMSKSSDVYDFNTSEDQLGSLPTIAGSLRSSLPGQASDLRDGGIDVNEYKMCEAQTMSDEGGKEKFSSPTKVSGNKSSKSKQNRVVSKKKSNPLPGTVDHSEGALSSPSFVKSNPDVFVREKITSGNFDINDVASTGSLNGDLSQLLASNNWNIPALQKVLAQHSAGDPEHLRQVIQQMMTQITAPSDSSFPVAKGCVSSLNSSDVSSVAAAFINNGINATRKQEDLIECSLTDGSIADKVDVVNSNATKALSTQQKAISQTSVTEGGIDQKNYLGQDKGGIIGISSIASSMSNTLTKPESQAKVSTQSTHKNLKGSVQMTTSSVPNTISATSSKPTTLASSSSTTMFPQQSSSVSTSMILNTVKSQSAQVVSMCTSSSNESSTTTTTIINVSKPVQMAQVIPNNLTGINQATAVLPTQQFLGTCTAPAQQLLNPHPSSSQNSPQQQIMNMNVNSLSLPGLNNPQLFISNNPLQQASPSSVATAQLSPAMAAAAAGQILAAQTQQHQQSALQQQMSPSFIPAAQLPKPCSVSISSLAMPSNTSGIPIVAGSNATCVADVSGSMQQGHTATLAGNVIAGPPQNSAAVVAAANASVYSSTTNQPVFVIPQAKPVQPQPPAPVVQLVGGSSQTINPTANGLQAGDVNMNQLLSQISADQNQQLQNLINAASAGGFNPAAATTLSGIQQQPAAWNALNLNAQQQQQLQLLQLQQLMLPTVISNQTQTLPAASVCCPTQTSTLMNAMVGQQGLQINQVVDVKTIQQNLTPAAATQGFNNHGLQPVAAPTAFSNQIQQLASPLTVQVGSAAATNQTIPTITPQASLSKSINIIQQQPAVPPQQQALQACPSSTIDSAMKKKAVTVSNKPIAYQSSQTTTAHKKASSDKDTPTNTLPTTPTTKPSTVVSANNCSGNNTTVQTKSTSTTTSKASSSKSKSKSKKSDSSKVKDPQTVKDEEHIANAVNQILAQAVQQQRELTLAAQNAPPPPPKSRNRKRDSQARARQAAAAQAAALQQAKEQELGKIASISDDVIFHHPLQPSKTLSAHAPPLPIHSLTNGLSPLSSSLSSTSMSSSISYSSTTPNIMNRQEPPSPQSLSHLVSNDKNNKTASNQLAISSSQSSNNVVVGRPVASVSSLPLPPPSLSSSSSFSSDLTETHPAPPLPKDPSPSLQLSAGRLSFMSTSSSTLAAAASSLSSSSKTVVSPGTHHHPQHVTSLASQKKPSDSSSFDSHIDAAPSLNMINGINNKSSFGHNNNDNTTNIGKSKNVLPLVSTGTALSNNSSGPLRKAPLIINPVTSVVGIAGSNSLTTSSSSSTGTTTKKGNISLKEHLSSIVFNKDKESGKKKSSAARSTNNSGSNVLSVIGKNTKSTSVVTGETATTVNSTLATLGFNNNTKSVAKATRSVVNGESVGSSKGVRHTTLSSTNNKNV